LTDSFPGVGEGGSGVQKRFTRQQQRENEEKELSNEAAADGQLYPLSTASPPETTNLTTIFRADEPDEMEILPDAPPSVDVLSKLPSDFFEALGSTKWKDRLETLQAWLETLKASPSIIDADFNNVTAALAKRFTDANINVVIAAANVVEGLAKGLGKDFGKYRGVVMMPMLERLKERKANVTDALGAALDEARASVSSLLECRLLIRKGL
jgi:hypothetical protein